MERFAALLGGKLQEADPKAVKEFGIWVAGKMKKLKEAAKAKDRYLKEEEEQYQAGLTRDGIKTAKY